MRKTRKLEEAQEKSFEKTSKNHKSSLKNSLEKP